MNPADYTATLVDETLFPRAAAYRSAINPDRIHERAASFFPWTERHVQAVWFDDHLRPGGLASSRGEPIEVEHPGRWNLEAGPDFLGAVLRVGRELRRVAGDVEIHIHPGGWKQHGHANDPRYARVRFHVTWFPGPVDESLFPAGTLHVALSDRCSVDMERIDLSAYPYAEPTARPALFASAVLDPDSAIRFLEAAGEERMRRKTQRMAWLIQRLGAAQALYEETAAALGYKHNKTPFRHLARALPLAELNRQYGTCWQAIYAVMAGKSGLLPRQPGPRWPQESRQELRRLWDGWWREAHRWEEQPAPARDEWRLAGVRPLNHPLRRMAALAQWVGAGFFSEVGGMKSASLETMCRFAPCFWSQRLSWNGPAHPAELVGEGRAQSILLNVAVPYRLATGGRPVLDDLPVEPLNSAIRETAAALFGPDHSPSIYRTALARQGLMLLFSDFILAGKTLEINRCRI